MSSFPSHVQYCLPKILLLLTLPIQPSLSVTPDGPTFQLIVKICNRTPDTQFCRDVLQQNLHSPSTDARTLVEISIRLVIVNVTNTLVAVKRAKARATKEVADLLTICEEGYDVVLNEYEEASLAISKNDIRTTLFDEEQSTSPIEDCIKNINPVVPQFQSYNTINLALHRVSVACAVIYYTEPRTFNFEKAQYLWCFIAILVLCGFFLLKLA